MQVISLTVRKGKCTSITYVTLYEKVGWSFLSDRREKHDLFLVYIARQVTVILAGGREFHRVGEAALNAQSSIEQSLVLRVVRRPESEEQRVRDGM